MSGKNCSVFDFLLLSILQPILYIVSVPLYPQIPMLSLPLTSLSSPPHHFPKHWSQIRLNTTLVMFAPASFGWNSAGGFSSLNTQHKLIPKNWGVWVHFFLDFRLLYICWATTVYCFVSHPHRLLDGTLLCGGWQVGLVRYRCSPFENRWEKHFIYILIFNYFEYHTFWGCTVTK